MNRRKKRSSTSERPPAAAASSAVLTAPPVAARFTPVTEELRNDNLVVHLNTFFFKTLSANFLCTATLKKKKDKSANKAETQKKKVISYFVFIFECDI